MVARQLWLRERVDTRHLLQVAEYGLAIPPNHSGRPLFFHGACPFIRPPNDRVASLADLSGTQYRGGRGVEHYKQKEQDCRVSFF